MVASVPTGYEYRDYREEQPNWVATASEYYQQQVPHLIFDRKVGLSLMYPSTINLMLLSPNLNTWRRVLLTLRRNMNRTMLMVINEEGSALECR